MQRQVTIRVSVAWWLRWYLSGGLLMCWMTGCRPHRERVAYWMRRAVRVRIE